MRAGLGEARWAPGPVGWSWCVGVQDSGQRPENLVLSRGRGQGGDSGTRVLEPPVLGAALQRRRPTLQRQGLNPVGHLPQLPASCRTGGLSLAPQPPSPPGFWPRLWSPPGPWRPCGRPRLALGAGSVVQGTLDAEGPKGVDTRSSSPHILGLLLPASPGPLCPGESRTGWGGASYPSASSSVKRVPQPSPPPRPALHASGGGVWGPCGPARRPGPLGAGLHVGRT